MGLVLRTCVLTCREGTRVGFRAECREPRGRGGYRDRRVTSMEPGGRLDPPRPRHAARKKLRPKPEPSGHGRGAGAEAAGNPRAGGGGMGGGEAGSDGADGCHQG